MTDVLAGGSPDRPPRRWPIVAAVVVLVALVVGSGVQHLLRRSSAAAPNVTPSPSALSPPVMPSPDVPPSGWTASPGNDEPVPPRLDGVPATAVPAGVQLVVGGPRPVALGAAAPKLAGLPVPVDWEVERVWAVPAGLLALIQHLHLNDAPSSKIYLVRPDGTALLLAAADQVVVGYDGKAIFALRSGPTGPDGSSSAPGVLSEVSLSGRVLDRRDVPAEFYPQADTAAGLLVTIYSLGNGSVVLQIVDRRTLAVRQRLGEVGGLVSATSTRAAWLTTGCTTKCQLVVADLQTGARHTVALAGGYQPGEVAFSPDGRRIAIGYFGRHPQQPGGAAPGVVDVVELTNGHRQRIPGLATAVKQAADLSWTPDGRWLAVGVGWPDADFRRIGLWPVAGGPVRVLPGRFAGGYLSGALLAL